MTTNNEKAYLQDLQDTNKAQVQAKQKHNSNKLVLFRQLQNSPSK